MASCPLFYVETGEPCQASWLGRQNTYNLDRRALSSRKGKNLDKPNKQMIAFGLVPNENQCSMAADGKRMHKVEIHSQDNDIILQSFGTWSGQREPHINHNFKIATARETCKNYPFHQSQRKVFLSFSFLSSHPYSSLPPQAVWHFHTYVEQPM